MQSNHGPEPKPYANAPVLDPRAAGRVAVHGRYRLGSGQWVVPEIHGGSYQALLAKYRVVRRLSPWILRTEAGKTPRYQDVRRRLTFPRSQRSCSTTVPRQQSKLMTASSPCQTQALLSDSMSWLLPSCPRLSDAAPRMSVVGVVTARLRLQQRGS